MSIRGVMFDWDGVLLDSLGASMNVYNRILPGLGMEPLSRERFLELQGPNWYEFYSKLGIPESRWSEVDKGWVRLYKEESLSLQPDARSCLTALRGSGFSLALITNGSRRRVEKELDGFNMREYFDSVQFGEKKEELKPSPIMLEKALRELGLRPENAVYAGDAPDDIIAAKNAGVPSIAVGRDPILAKRLLAEKPDYLVGDLEELTNILQSRT